MARDTLTYLDLIQNAGDWVTLEQVHDRHELIYLLSPGYQVEVEGRIVKGRPGEAMLYRQGVHHQTAVSRDLTVRYFCLQWRGPAAGLPHAPAPVFDASGRMLFLLQWMWELRPGGAAAKKTLSRLLALLLEEYFRLRTAPPGTFPESVTRYLEMNLHRAVGLREVAAATRLSVRQLVRRFHRETGETPGKRLQRLRVQRALSLVRNTAEPLKSIAQTVGFSSAAHLAMLIRRETGRTPGSYRRAGGTWSNPAPPAASR
jgi:AraC-like DNA-binding protein